MSSWQLISEHFLNLKMASTWHRNVDLSYLRCFFTCLRRPSNSLLSLPNSWTNEKTKVIKYILTNVERLRKYAKVANFRQTDPHCTCKSDTKDNAKVRLTWSTAHTTIWRMLWYFLQWPTEPSLLAPRPSPLAPRPSPLAPRPSPLAPRPSPLVQGPKLTF